jgi:hypothetical protein
MRWIGLPHSHNDKSDETDIQFEMLNDTDGLYIAYDSRANDKPDWLDAVFSAFDRCLAVNCPPLNSAVRVPQEGAVFLFM